MSGDAEAIRRVIEAFERSTWSEIDVRLRSTRVHLRADGAASAGSRPAPATESAPPATPSPSYSDAANASITSYPSTAEEIAPDSVVVRSPSPGIFWRSPQPGVPPFADVGERVEITSTLCIVEVMKLMNHVKAGVAGTVVAVFGRDGVGVDKDEPLFAIDTGTNAS